MRDLKQVIYFRQTSPLGPWYECEAGDIGAVAFIRRTQPEATAPAQDLSAAIGDTGNVEADRLINRLMSSDPDFDDCADAAAFILRMVIENKGPDGFATWRDAAVAERMKRTSGENCCSHGIHYDNACGACIPPRGTTVYASSANALSAAILPKPVHFTEKGAPLYTQGQLEDCIKNAGGNHD